ncbi:MAG: AAA family ATPase [Candidatus Thiodiazotropha sp. (ex Ustalcina ferruginea)]|nr:AAA family ATPase [Candidatus Thiodiazotropha sp. (ex Ustalcina ferruginea)]
MVSFEIDETEADEHDESVRHENDRDSNSKLLGISLVDQGKIESKDIEKILSYSQKHMLRFGEAAVKLKLLTRQDLDEAIAAHFNYPYLGKEERDIPKELVAALRPFSAKGEALRTLRAQLTLRWFSKGKKTLAVVGSHGKSGSSYIAANLALVWSQLGDRTLLVDADLSCGRQHALFGVKNEIGLSSVLIGRSSLESAIKPLGSFSGLSLLPSGAPPPNPGELLERNNFSSILDSLREEYSVVLFDAPPVMNAGGGAEFVAARCEGALVILRKNRTPLSVASKSIDRIRSYDTEIVGSVLTDF